MQKLLDQAKVYWPLAQPYVYGAVRHGLTVAGGYMIARGLPGLQGSTISDLSGFVVGGIGLALSMFDKAKRP